MNLSRGILVALVSSATALTCLLWKGRSIAKILSTFDSAGSKEAGSSGIARVNPGCPADFSNACDAVNAVVHVRARSREKNDRNFGGSGRESLSSASGVILTDDGFIVTNDHVIKDAVAIRVTLPNKHSYVAELAGADPLHDLAVLKIREAKLPFVLLGNSDEARVGDWVLAIGYPWNLDETITAGIVSAKTHLSVQHPVSYHLTNLIQTDAAINLGNSGGALVNNAGELIGINTLLVSPNKVYTGYGYAIPVNDIKESIEHIIGSWKESRQVR
ncbi:MAG TPA: trypsin-like peptidase domain-containing protein [Puia sp.]|nr:trypsin-like peptidase domain-containing protein [Puia sp.]